MANIADDITELVGNTPLLRLHKFEKEAGFEGKILAKLEVFNPTGSVKDRIAKNMIEQAERDRRLKPGGTIIEATSGNHRHRPCGNCSSERISGGHRHAGLYE